MTTVEHTSFASPLTLLSQWQEKPEGDPLRELLVLGYTADLVFLERFAVSRARQLGARVTVVSDADQQIHDPVDVRFAGHVYQHGSVTLPGAFHPKLAVLVGEDDVWAAVGSGNPTMSGWGHNHELWCVLRGRRDRGLRAQSELGEWLAELPRHVAMPTWIAETLAEVGSAVRPADIDDSRPDVRLLHNLTAPIIDGLPTDAAEVNLAAPFIDPSGAAVRASLERARPDRVR
ncbi:MAG: phospholipase D family protein, partial [Tomitella sp.]|nr:phospholipase D family protein [Tomitella sp.]